MCYSLKWFSKKKKGKQMQDATRKEVPKYPIYKPQKQTHTAHPGDDFSNEVTVKCCLKGVAGDLHAKKEGKKLKLTFFKHGGESAIKLDSLTIEAVKKALALPGKTITTNAGIISNLRSDHLERLVNPDK